MVLPSTSWAVYKSKSGFGAAGLYELTLTADARHELSHSAKIATELSHYPIMLYPLSYATILWCYTH